MAIQRVCVVGAGAMGRQIGLNAAIHNIGAVVYDVDSAQLEDARCWSDEYLAGRVTKGRMTQEKADEVADRIRFEPGLKEALINADLVIEAVVEDLDVKAAVFADLDRLSPQRAILATNSSMIPSSRLAPATKRPEKVANLHFFNPALVMKLVEIVGGPHTDLKTLDALVRFAERVGKIPVRLKREITGFIANRLMHAVAREAIALFEGGYASHEDIDTAAELGLGYPMGPFNLMDLTGIDIAYRVRMERYRETGDEEDKPPQSIVERYERGEYGRKTGKGWYTYDSMA